jgi:hypothetical protein
MKPPAKGQRVSLGLKVTAAVKRHIDSEARASGRTQSQEAEALIERALQYDRVLQAMGTTVEKIEWGSIEAALRRRGYTAIHHPRGDIWLPPGYRMERSPGFMTQEESDRFIAQEEGKK